MNIGILTFHCAYNFGATLQCYALYSFLKEQHYDVEVINYRPAYLETSRTRFGIRTFVNRKPYSTIKRTIRTIIRDHKFESFISQNIKLSERCFNQKEYKSVVRKFDMVIIGSDQVWNTTYNGNDPIWYGHMLEDRQKRLGYAVSAGNPRFSEHEKEALHVALKKFSAISVRETCLASVVTPLTSLNVQTVLDPSLMVSPTIWSKWKKKEDKKFIVVYQARCNDNTFRIAESLSRKTGNPIVALDLYRNSFESGYQKILSPAEFISIINNAYCVVTTSFHGTAFSIIMNTPFYTLRLNDGADTRSEELLRLLSAEERMIEADADVDSVEMDFTSINAKLENLRNKSQTFLLDNIGL